MTFYRFPDCFDREDWEGPPGCRFFALGLDDRARRWTPSGIIFTTLEEAAQRNAELQSLGKQERWAEVDYTFVEQSDSPFPATTWPTGN